MFNVYWFQDKQQNELCRAIERFEVSYRLAAVDRFVAAKVSQDWRIVRIRKYRAIQN